MASRLMTWRATVALAALAAGGAGAQAPVEPQSVVLRAMRLVDVVRGVVIDAPAVVIAGDRIVSVGPGLVVPPGARVIDLGTSTLLPGLIDSHTHLLTRRATSPFTPELPTSRTVVMPASSVSRAFAAPGGSTVSRTREGIRVD